MLSKNKTKLIRSLSKKKVRENLELFVAEGDKLVAELLQAELPCSLLVATEKWLQENSGSELAAKEVFEVEKDEISTLSQLVSPQNVLAVFETPQYRWDNNLVANGLCLYLDQVQDPGNLGTIFRLADWFGISAVVCGKGTVDVFSSKVVQATMGAVAKVKFFYVEPDTFFASLGSDLTPVYGTFMEGDSVYSSQLQTKGIVVLGNEGQGISQTVEKYVNKRISIPSFNTDKSSESLNVATAAAVLCSEFCRPSNT